MASMMAGNDSKSARAKKKRQAAQKKKREAELLEKFVRNLDPSLVPVETQAELMASVLGDNTQKKALEARRKAASKAVIELDKDEGDVYEVLDEGVAPPAVQPRSIPIVSETTQFEPFKTVPIQTDDSPHTSHILDNAFMHAPSPLLALVEGSTAMDIDIPISVSQSMAHFETVLAVPMEISTSAAPLATTLPLPHTTDPSEPKLEAIAEPRTPVQEKEGKITPMPYSAPVSKAENISSLTVVSASMTPPVSKTRYDFFPTHSPLPKTRPEHMPEVLPKDGPVPHIDDHEIMLKSTHYPLEPNRDSDLTMSRIRDYSPAFHYGGDLIGEFCHTISEEAPDVDIVSIVSGIAGNPWDIYLDVKTGALHMFTNNLSQRDMYFYVYPHGVDSAVSGCGVYTTGNAKATPKANCFGIPTVERTMSDLFTAALIEPVKLPSNDRKLLTDHTGTYEIETTVFKAPFSGPNIKKASCFLTSLSKSHVPNFDGFYFEIRTKAPITHNTGYFIEQTTWDDKPATIIHVWGIQKASNQIDIRSYWGLLLPTKASDHGDEHYLSYSTVQKRTGRRYVFAHETCN